MCERGYSKDGAYAQFYQNAPEEKRYEWNLYTVKKILSDELYIGNNICNRAPVISFKPKKQTAELRKAEKRKSAVTELFVKIYEDWSAGRITESNFNLLSERYQGEQVELASMTDNKVTPYDVAKWSAQNGYRCEGNGSYHSLIPNGGEHYGLTVTKIGKDSKKLVETLESGKLVIAIMAPGHFTTTGHFIFLRGITEEGNVLVADPASVKRSNQEWALGIITNEAATRAGAGGPFWVFSR